MVTLVMIERETYREKQKSLPNHCPHPFGRVHNSFITSTQSSGNSGLDR